MIAGPPPSLDDLESLARAAWDEIAPEFKRLAGDVLIRVEEIAGDELLAELEIEEPLELTGLYVGVDLTHRSIDHATPTTPMVFLYRLPILFEWIERGDVTLADLVSHVLVHEIGHHFGFSDEQMDDLLELAEEAPDEGGGLPRLDEVMRTLEARSAASQPYDDEARASRARVAAFILVHAQPSGDFAFTHAQIGDAISLPREAVTRTLLDLERDGLIRVASARIEVLDAQTLKHVAED